MTLLPGGSCGEAARTGLLLQVASTFTSIPIEPSLRSALAGAGVADELGFVQYGQIGEYMLSPVSEVSHVAGTLVLLRVEDWLRQDLKSAAPESAVESWARPRLRAHLDEFVSQLTALAGRGKQVWFLACPSSGWLAERYRLGTLCRTFTNLVTARVQQIPRLTVLRWPGSSLKGEVDDRSTDRLGQIPFTLDAFRQLGENLGVQIARTVIEKAPGSEPGDTAKASAELAAYLAGLQVQVEFKIAGRDDSPHVDRLLRTAATFSLTGQQQDLADAEVDAWIETESAMVLEVRDRLSEHGPCGVVVSHADGEALVVTGMSLSCAVLGRQVEYAAVSGLARIAADRGFAKLIFECHPDGRNLPTLAFLQSIADAESQTRYVLPVSLAETRLNAAAVSAGAWTTKFPRTSCVNVQ